MFKLPIINFSLPEWEPKRDFSIYSNVTHDLKKMQKKTGFQSDVFKKSCNVIYSISKDGRVSEIPCLIRKPLDVRALTTLWLSDLFFDNCPVTKELIDALYNPRNVLSKLVVQQLLRLFFQRFEQVGDLDALIHCLHKELSSHVKQLNASSLGKLIQHKEKIISHEGPSWIAKTAMAEQVDLDFFIDKIGLKSFADTRFYSICQNHYYLEQLRVLEPGQAHPLLEEIIKPSVYQTPYNQTEMLGHEILRILIDRSPKEGVDEKWQGVILTIAGDPRIAKTSKKFQLWWEVLGESRIKKVKTWLSKFNLMLFLKILEDLGRVRNNTDMNRMFPARKKFLEGLYDLGLIEDSRLFINFRETYYLEANYRSEELPEYAKVSTSLSSLIYLKVAGKYMVEGTHNFKLWLFDKFDEESPLLDYSIKSYKDRDIRKILESEYLRALPKSSAIVHSSGWQHRAIETFEMLGIKLPPEFMLTENEYIRYKEKYGLDITSKGMWY